MPPSDHEPGVQPAVRKHEASNPVAPIPAFNHVFKENVAYVWRVLRYLGVADADLEDCVQEVFLVVHRKLPSFEGRSAIRTWIYSICIRVASGQRRRAHVRRERVTDEPPERITEASQPRKVDQARARQLLAKSLEDLDEEKRAVFVLAEIEERPMSEVAEILGCPVRTAYSRLEVARKLVTRSWKRALLKEVPQ